MTSANQAQYGDDHLRRLKLVRALIGVGGLPLAGVIEVLNAVDEADGPRREQLRLGQLGITTAPVAEQDVEAEREVRTFLARQGWDHDEDNSAVRSLVAVLATARGLGHGNFADCLDSYAEGCRQIAEADVAHVLGHAEVADTIEGVVVGSVLGDAVTSALRRLCHQKALRRELRF